MTRINDFEFSIAVKIAANRCLAADVEEFLALDTEDTVVDPNVEKRVARKLRFDEWKDVRRISVKTLKYAMIALVSAVSLFFGLAMSIQPVRAAFFGAIVTWYEDYIDVRYEEDTDDTEHDLVAVKLTYLPDGWSITDEHFDNGLYSCDITNSGDGFVRFSQNKDFETGLKVDSDVYEQEIVYLKNDTIESNLFILDDHKYILVWKDKYMFKLAADNIELEELIMIAEGIE